MAEKIYNDSFRKRYKAAPVAISENTVPYDTLPHIHREVEMLYVKDGKAEITVSDRKYSARAGDMVIVNPMEVHSVVADRSVDYHQRCICFDSSLIADKVLREALVSGEAFVSGYHFNNDKITKELLDIFEELFSAVSESSEELYLESVAYISLLFAKLKKSGLVVFNTKSNKKSLFARNVQEYLSAHFHEQITSADIANELFYNQSYFCRLFRDNFGVSFLDYLMLYRISNAKLIMSSENISVSQVAERVGFLDASYFSRCFKRIAGISPTEYQKRQFCINKKSI